MTLVFNYKEKENGKYDVILEDVHIPYKNLEDLQFNLGTEIDVHFVDPDNISHKQRKLIFALLNDIEAYTGDPVEYRRHFLTREFMLYKDIEYFSLSDCEMGMANDFIDFILTFMFRHNIPLRYETSDLMKEDKNFIYLCTLKRKCVICGAENAELAHYHAVGSGRNRKTISHIGNRILPLCHKHHSEQHAIGMKSFNDKYKLKNSWIKVDERLNRILKGQRDEGL